MAFPAIAIQLGISVGLWALNKYVLADDPEPPTKPKPKALRLPKAGVGTMLPLTYGTYRLDTPPIVWSGNNAIESTGEHRVDLLFCAGIPCSEIHSAWRVANPPRLKAIWVNGNRIPLGSGGAGLLHGENGFASASFGGAGNGGYLDARVVFFDGRADQVVTGDLYVNRALQNANLGIPINANLVPGYAHQMIVAIITSPNAYNPSAPADFGSLGETQTLFSCGLEIDSYGPSPIQADDGRYDANPAMVLYDLICGQVYKLGYPTSLVDKPSFDAAATTLTGEVHGASGVFSEEGEAPRLIVSLLDQMNGIVFEDHATGKLRLKLIRNDYSIDTIPALTWSNTIGEPKVDFVGWSELSNQVDVEFTDRSLGFVKNNAPAQRGASAVGQSNRIRARTVRYPCVHSQALAATLAARELGVAARPLMTATCKVKRERYALNYGDAVKVQWTGIVENKVFRVVDIDHGQLADSAITLSLVEDVFDQTEGGYSPVDPDWQVDPHLPEILEG